LASSPWRPSRSWNGATPASSPPAVAEGQTLQISGIVKQFGRFPALNDVSLTIKDGEFLALLGPSGSGKTTLLRLLAGLDRPDAGAVLLGGEDFLALTPRRRRVGLVFQHYALFRHMTVAQNIAFGLKVRPRRERPAAAEVRRRVGDLLGLVQLEGLEARYPTQLSGGQRQRVALARALAIEPRLLLLDEPFGALDAQVRRDLRRWLREVHDRTGVTTVFVTHDQEEALDLADRVAVLRHGQIVQIGAPQDLYDNPIDSFVYQFLGPACRLEGRIEGGRLTVAGWESAAPAGTRDGAVEVFFRPDETRVRPPGLGLTAEILSVALRGLEARVVCAIDGQMMELQLLRADLPADLIPGQALALEPLQPRLYPREA
jgi:sulfate transport system ATP-binding protein